jgi:hypothetical protein
VRVLAGLAREHAKSERRYTFSLLRVNRDQSLKLKVRKRGAVSIKASNAVASVGGLAIGFRSKKFACFWKV